MEDLVKDGDKDADEKRAAILKDRVAARDTEFNDAAKERSEKDEAELQEIGARRAAAEKASNEEAAVKEAA